MPGLESMAFLSPSHQYAAPLMVFAIEALVPAVRGQAMRGRWATAAIGLAVLGGAKSSALPVMVCGAALVIAVALVRRRAVRAQIVTLGLTLLGVVCVSIPLASTGGAGSTVQLLATMGRTKPWEVQFGSPGIDAFHDPILPGLDSPAGLLFVGLLLILYAIALAWVVLAGPRLRAGDGAAWFLLGIGIAGFAAMMIISQASLSQVYFMRGAMVALNLLAAIGIADLMRGRVAAVSPWRRWCVVLAGAGWGGAVAFAAQWAGGPRPDHGEALGSLGRSMGVFAALTVVSVVGGVIAQRRGHRWAVFAGAGAVLGAAVLPSLQGPAHPLLSGAHGLLVALLVAAVGAGLAVWSGPTRLPARRPVRAAIALVAACAATVALLLPVVGYADRLDTARARSKSTLTDAELGAARWIAANVAEFDLVATNAHCLQVKTTPSCDARSFWVSGLGGRRVLVEGWPYTVAGREAHGRGGHGYFTADFSDPALLALNDAAFTEPTRDRLDELYGKGVRYLLADQRASEVDWRALDALAERTYGDPSRGALVYRLRTPA
ncbi:hypothetical protein [Propionicicella superfundia]|uniref:hypothetical protein n=1 Tax=Propionicicella superfundia TaxID=348582 RepID=UPI0004906F05|nr:hypothetical protein [Propionicicella superfundia]